MAIITVAEYQAFPYYRTFHEGTEIAALIPAVETDFLDIQGRDWLRITATVTSGSAELSDIDNDYELTAFTLLHRLSVGDLLVGTGVRAQISSIDHDDETITLDGNATASGSEVALIVYPRGARLIAARMIAFHLNEARRDSALSSESLGSHNMATDRDRINGYPRTVVAGIKRYARAAG